MLYTTETWEGRQKTAPLFKFPGFSPCCHVTQFQNKSSYKIKHDSLVQSIFLLDYKFFYILFVNVVACKTGASQSVTLKSDIALLLSLAAEGLSPGPGLGRLHSGLFALGCSEVKLGPTP